MAGLSMARRFPPALLGAMLLSAALAACGGGSSSPTANFLARADSVCRQAQQQFDRIQATPPVTAGQAGKQTSALIDVSKGAFTDLRDLTPPSSLKGAYDRYLAARQQALQYLQNGLDAINKRNGTAYAKAKRQTAAQQATRLQLAHRVGLKQCSRPAAPAGGSQ
jgi:hypothetical protein